MRANRLRGYWRRRGAGPSARSSGAAVVEGGGAWQAEACGDACIVTEPTAEAAEPPPAASGRSPQPATAPAAPAVAEPDAAGQSAGATDDELARGFVAALLQMAGHAPGEQRMTCFHAVSAPTMSLEDYMARIQRFFGCSGSCYVLGFMYIDRLTRRHPDVLVGPLSCHRLLVTSMMVATKFHDDIFYSNMYYAKVGGVRVQEMNALEARFAKLLEWNLHVQPEEYADYRDMLHSAAQGL